MTTNNPNLPVVRNQLTPSTWQMIEAVAPAMHQARLFGVSSPEQAMAIMLKGHELGLGLTASFEFIHVIENKPALSPRGALALVLAHPEYDGIEIQDKADAKGNPTACTVQLKRKNGLCYEITWTMEDAKRAGIVKSGGNWEKYPANMLRWRAVGYAIDVVFPDAIGGMKRADEFGADLTADGDVIEGSWKVQTAPARATTPEPEPESTGAPVQPTTDTGNGKATTPTPTLADLVQRYGAEAVMSANFDRIPGTDKELAQVAEALEAQSA